MILPQLEQVTDLVVRVIRMLAPLRPPEHDLLVGFAESGLFARLVGSMAGFFAQAAHRSWLLLQRRIAMLSKIEAAASLWDLSCAAASSAGCGSGKSPTARNDAQRELRHCDGADTALTG
jgi:hypothetical protein